MTTAKIILADIKNGLLANTQTNIEVIKLLISECNVFSRSQKVNNHVYNE